jgi:hypothetical protein
MMKALRLVLSIGGSTQYMDVGIMEDDRSNGKRSVRFKLKDGKGNIRNLDKNNPFKLHYCYPLIWSRGEKGYSTYAIRHTYADLIYIYIYIYIYMHIYIYIHIHKYIHKSVYIDAYIFSYKAIYVLYIYIHTQYVPPSNSIPNPWGSKVENFRILIYIDKYLIYICIDAYIFSCKATYILYIFIYIYIIRTSLQFNP